MTDQDYKIQEALSEAVAAIYFTDSSDYKPALHKIVQILGGDKALELLLDKPRLAYKHYCEFGCVALTVEKPDHNLHVGDRGVIVHVYKTGVFEVEFARKNVTLTLPKTEIRPLTLEEIE